MANPADANLRLAWNYERTTVQQALNASEQPRAVCFAEPTAVAEGQGATAVAEDQGANAVEEDQGDEYSFELSVEYSFESSSVAGDIIVDSSGGAESRDPAAVAARGETIWFQQDIQRDLLQQVMQRGLRCDATGRRPRDPAAVAPLPLWFQQVIQRDLLCDATGRRAKAAVAVPAAVADGPMPPYHVILEFMVRKLIANLPDSFPVEQKPDVPPFSWYCSDAEDPHFKISEGILPHSPRESDPMQTRTLPQ